MPTLITLEQAKNHLRLTDWGESPSPEDDDLQLKIDAATSAVITFIERYEDEDWADEIAGWTETTVPRDIKGAVFDMLEYLWRFRGGDVEQDRPRLGLSGLPTSTEGILTRWHDPALGA